MLKIRSLLLSSAILISLSACGSVVNGNSQVIYVNALPNNNKATSCTLENERGSWSAPFLPSSVSVSRANGPLTVTCNSVDGYHGSISVKSDVSASAVAGGLGGGLAMGGGLASAGVATGGVAVAAGVGAVGGSAVADSYYGGGFVYPDSVVVPMYPTLTPAPKEAQGFPYSKPATVAPTQSRPVYHHRAMPTPVAPSRGNS